MTEVNGRLILSESATAAYVRVTEPCGVPNLVCAPRGALGDRYRCTPPKHCEQIDDSTVPASKIQIYVPARTPEDSYRIN